jgi:WD40 repeat protein
LLQEKHCKDPELQTRYLKLRSELFRRRYGNNADVLSLPSEKSLEIKGKSRIVLKKPAAESFAGVHHVFDQHSAAISMLKFANNDRSRFCCASIDGTISICEATSNPPKVVSVLQGHRKGVTAIDWSTSNDFLVSSSLDTTIRLWMVQSNSKINCLRVVCDQLRAESLCCAFAPSNNNIVLTGNSQGLLQILNVSTGKYTRGGTMKIGGKVIFYL